VGGQKKKTLYTSTGKGKGLAIIWGAQKKAKMKKRGAAIEKKQKTQMRSESRRGRGTCYLISEQNDGSGNNKKLIGRCLRGRGKKKEAVFFNKKLRFDEISFFWGRRMEGMNYGIEPGKTGAGN